VNVWLLNIGYLGMWLWDVYGREENLIFTGRETFTTSCESLVPGVVKWTVNHPVLSSYRDTNEPRARLVPQISLK
jgi:hypothetical protein